MKFEKFKYKTDFTLEDNQIVLTVAGQEKVKRRKKITGSRLGSVLGVNEYVSPFQAWCDILGFYKSEGEDYFTNAGDIIEEKLRNYATEKLNQKFISYTGPACGYDVFKENKIFGGMPDGEPVDTNGKISYQNNNLLLEIKTASIDEYLWTKKNNELFLERNPKTNLPIVKKRGTKIVKWIKNKKVFVPLSYQYQISLYLYLRGVTDGVFCVGLLKDEDYQKPEDFKVDERIVILEKIRLDLKEFEKVIAYAEKWYQKHVIKGISPKLTPQDLQWFRYGYSEI